MRHHPIIDSADLIAALPARSLEGEERRAKPAQVAQVAEPTRYCSPPVRSGSPPPNDELLLARAIPFRTLASITCCPSPAPRTSATCPGSASSGCPDSPA